MMINEKGLKRLIRAMNSVLNLYDVENIPEEITDVLMEGVIIVADTLNLTAIALYDKDTNEILKYIMPEDFSAWLNGETSNVEQESEETGGPL